VNYETKFKHLPQTSIPSSQQGFLPLQHDHSSIILNGRWAQKIKTLKM